MLARQSLQAMTSEHGRLLLASGFTKRASLLPTSGCSEPTGMSNRPALFCPYLDRTGRRASGRPAIHPFPKTAGQSTLDRLLRELPEPSDLLTVREQLYSSRIYCLPSRWPALLTPSECPSLEQSARTQLSLTSSALVCLPSSGRTRTSQDAKREQTLRAAFYLLDRRFIMSELRTIQRATATLKSRG